MSFVHLQHGQKRFLGISTLPTCFIRFLPAFCFQQLALAAHVTPVALGQHVLAQRLDGGAGDDLIADGGLNHDLEHLARN